MDYPAHVWLAEQEADGVRDRLGRGRVADLVIHHLERIAVLRAETRHGVDEGRAAGAVEPGDAHDDRLGQDHLHHALAGELRRAVDGARARDVGLAPGPGLARRLAGKDVVGGDRDQPRAAGGGGDGDIARALLVEPESEVALLLAVVDAGHRGAVDDDVGLDGGGPGGEGIGVEDVPFRQVGDDNFVVGELMLERTPEHSLPAGDEDLHLPDVSSDERANSRTMFAPSSTICQLM